MSLDHKLLLRVGDAADRLSISRAYLYEQIAAGRIRTIKIGAATRIPVAELDRFVKECDSSEFTVAGAR